MDAAIELRRPAAAILLASDVLRTALERKASDEEIRRLVSIISANSVNLVRLAGAAVDRKPEESVVVRRYELSGLLDDVLAEVEPWARQIGVRLEVKKRPATVLADAPRLRYVVRALLTNAISSSGSGGAVRLRVSAGLTVVRVFVTDGGAASLGGAPRDSGRNPARHTDVSAMISTARSLLQAQGGRLDHTTHDEAGATYVVTVRRGGAHPSGSLT